MHNKGAKYKCQRRQLQQRYVVSLYGSANTLYNEPCALDDGKRLGDDICFTQIPNLRLGKSKYIRLNICYKGVRSWSQVSFCQQNYTRYVGKKIGITMTYIEI